MSNHWNFHSAGQLVFGSGVIHEIGELTRRHGFGKVLIITDKVLVDVGAVGSVEDSFQGAGVDVRVFDGGEPEPSIRTAELAVEAARSFQPDAVVGVGGGSNMDLAKCVAALYTHSGSPEDYFGFGNVPGPVLPIVCVPTTAGTGSEVSHSAVLTDIEKEMKISMLSNFLRPMFAVVDPMLTLTCPPTVTADSGIDALVHAIEAYTARDSDDMEEPLGYQGRFPITDCLAAEAIQLIGGHLVTAYNEPGNLEARENMALAATLAGMAFSNAGVAIVHALEYPMGGALHCSHGAGNGLLLPYVMRFNLPDRAETMARIALLLGRDVDGLSPEEGAIIAIEAVEDLRRVIGIPLRIRDLGGREEQLPGFAMKAHALDRLTGVNPRKVTLEDLEQILRDAF
jgi:alcohol dehydrogenase class IV